MCVGESVCVCTACVVQLPHFAARFNLKHTYGRTSTTALSRSPSLSLHLALSPSLTLPLPLSSYRVLAAFSISFSY